MSCRIWVPIWNHKAFRPAAMKVELGLAPVPLWRIIPVHIRFTKWSRPPMSKLYLLYPIVTYQLPSGMITMVTYLYTFGILWSL